MKPLKQRTACPILAAAGVLPKRRTAGAISLARAIWVAGLLTVMSGATAPAAIINYVIHNNGGLNDTSFGRPGGGDLKPVDVAGRFTYDTATYAISNFNVTFTGDSLIQGTYTDTSHPHFGFYNDQQVLAFRGYNLDGHGVDVRLTLGDLNQYEIVGGHWFQLGDQSDQYDLLLRDGRNPPAIVRVVSGPAVPEPSTWAMVLGAFASAGAVTRIGRRKEYTK